MNALVWNVQCKQDVGEQLYTLLTSAHPELSSRTGKVTGMLLELPPPTLELLLTSPELLGEHVSSIVSALDQLPAANAPALLPLMLLRENVPAAPEADIPRAEMAWVTADKDAKVEAELSASTEVADGGSVSQRLAESSKPVPLSHNGPSQPICMPH